MRKMYRFAVVLAVAVSQESTSSADKVLSCQTEELAAEVASELGHALPGNSSSGGLTGCTLSFDNAAQSATVTATLRMHVKHRHCEKKVWPLKGSWCADEYNNWADGLLRLRLSRNCTLDVEQMSVNFTGGPGGIYGNEVVALFTHTAWGQERWRALRTRLEQRLRDQVTRSPFAQYCAP